MFVHIFAFRWRADATSSDRARALAEIKTLRQAIPLIRELWVGENVTPQSKEYGTTGVMLFDTAAAYAEYQGHAAHLKLLEWLVPLIEPMELDFHAV
jgi:hypothetical protein